jgi:hypothetical protein
MEDISEKISNLSKKEPEERSSAVFLNLTNGDFLLFGGGSRTKEFNDFWILKVVQLKSNMRHIEYSWEEYPKQIPNHFPARFGCVGAVTTCNNSHEVYIHGGQNNTSCAIYADFFSIQLPSNTNIFKDHNITYKNLTCYPINPSKTPKERNSHSIVQKNDLIYIFGGGNSEGLLNDLWCYCKELCKWQSLKISGELIQPREMHGMSIYEEKIYIFGGRLYESIDNNIFCLTKKNESEFNCEIICKLPQGLCAFAYATYKNYIFIYGGTDGVDFNNNIFIFNLLNKKLAKSKIQVPGEGRITSMMSIDENMMILVIFGGSSLLRDYNNCTFLWIKELLDENNMVPA